jgi:segregation and condensation protein B
MEEKDPVDQTAAARAGDDEPREAEAVVEERATTETAQESSPETAPETALETVPEGANEPAPDASSSEVEGSGDEQESLTEEISADELVLEDKATDEDAEKARLRAVVEAVVYITEDPLTAKQLAEALEEPLDKVTEALDALVAEYEGPQHGLVIREVAEGYKMGTKAEYHDSLRTFVKKLQKPLKLSMAALETLAVVSYKQPITAPEIIQIRGVQGVGVLKTLLDRKLITTAGRKNVVGKPMLYRTTKEFLVQFGLKNLKELPTLKEFEELARVALADAEEAEEAPQQQELIPVEDQGAEELAEGTEEITAESAENAEGLKVEEQEVEGEATVEDQGAEELTEGTEEITAESVENAEGLKIEEQEVGGEPEADEEEVDPKGPQSETAEVEEPGEEKRQAAPEE